MKTIIKFLYDNYCGVYSFKLFGKYWTATKASRIMFPFFVMWGSTQLFKTNWELAWWDIPFAVLAILQYIAGFTNVVVNLHKKYIAG